jgi:exonuclease III
MPGITINLSILTLNSNGLNSPIKRHKLASWIKKEYLIICCLQETHLIDRNKHYLRVKQWKKIYQANGPPKQAGASGVAQVESTCLAKIGRSSNTYIR